MSGTDKRSENRSLSADYSDMLDMPHHVSARRPHMSIHDRAAQFAPFAALTGYEDAVEMAAETYIAAANNALRHENIEDI